MTVPPTVETFTWAAASPTKIDRTRADPPPHRDPAVVDGNASSLKFNRIELALFEEAFEAAAHVGSRLADHAQRAARGRFGDEPVKVGRVVRHKPDARRVRRHVLRQGHNRLDQRDGLERRPSGGTSHAAGCAVTTDDGVGVNLFAGAVGAALRLDNEPSSVGMERVEAAAELDLHPGALRLGGKALNQGAPLDDEIGMIQADRRGAAIGEKLEAADFIEDAAFGGAAQEREHAMSDDQSPRGRFEGFDAFQDADGEAAPRQQKRGKQSGGRPADHRDTWSIRARGGNGIAFFRALWVHHHRFEQSASCANLVKPESSEVRTKGWAASISQGHAAAKGNARQGGSGTSD